MYVDSFCKNPPACHAGQSVVDLLRGLKFQEKLRSEDANRVNSEHIYSYRELRIFTNTRLIFHVVVLQILVSFFFKSPALLECLH